nr:hypothetical protein [uncultured Actinomyces sp.]
MADLTWYSREGADQRFLTKTEAAGLASKEESTQGDAALSSRIDSVKATADAALPSATASSTYATKTELAQARLGGGGQAPDLSGYLTRSDASGTYVTKADAQATYPTKSEVAATYATKSELAQAGGGSPAPAPTPPAAPLSTLPLRAGQPVPTVGFFGDSWSTESMMGAGFNLPATASRLLGCIPVVSAVDGSGFAHSVSGNDAFEADARVNAICAAAPNLIVTVGSLNSDKVIENGNADGSNITAAVKTFIEKVRARLPQVPIVVVGAEPSSVARLISSPSHINVKAAKAGVEAAGGAAAGVVFVDWMGVADRQAVTWRDERVCATGDIVVYNGVAYRVTQPWVPAPGVTPASAGAPTVQVSDVLSGTGNEGNKSGDGTRDTLLMSDDTHPTKIGAIAFGAALAKHVGDAVAALSSWIKAQGPVVPAPSATPAPPQPPTPKGLPIMAWMPSGWGQPGRAIYSKAEVDAIAALKPDKVALTIQATADSNNAAVAIATTAPQGGKEIGQYGLATLRRDGNDVAGMVEAMDSLEGAGIEVMPYILNGKVDNSATYYRSSDGKLLPLIAARPKAPYTAIHYRGQNRLREIMTTDYTTFKRASDNTDGPADWQVSDVKNASIGILGPNAGAPGWGAAKTAFPGGVWAVVSTKDEQATAESLAKAAGVTLLGWAVPTPEAMTAIRA